MTKISCQDFLASFQAQWDSSASEELRVNWVRKKRWTELMLKGSKDNPSFLQKVMEGLSNKEALKDLSYKTEWYTVDALYVGGSNLHGSPGDMGYPSHVHALIEHENGEDVETEMWKLLHWRSPLKVLMFYDYAENEKKSETRKDWLDSKLETLHCMRSRVDGFFSENRETTYLFLIGNKDNDGDIQWRWITDRGWDNGCGVKPLGQ